MQRKKETKDSEPSHEEKSTGRKFGTIMLSNNAFFSRHTTVEPDLIFPTKKIIIRESFCCTTTTAIKVKSGKPLLEMNQTCFVLHFEAPSYTTERTNALEFRAKKKK